MAGAVSPASILAGWAVRATKCYGPMMIPASLRNLCDRLTVAWHERAVALKAVSFAVVGLVNSVVDFGVFSFGYYYLVLPIIAANALAWVVAVTGSYVLNSTITFAARIRPQAHGYEATSVSRCRRSPDFSPIPARSGAWSSCCTCRPGPPKWRRSRSASWSISRFPISWCSVRAIRAPEVKLERQCNTTAI